MICMTRLMSWWKRGKLPLETSRVKCNSPGEHESRNYSDEWGLAADQLLLRATLLGTETTSTQTYYRSAERCERSSIYKFL